MGATKDKFCQILFIIGLSLGLLHYCSEECTNLKQEGSSIGASAPLNITHVGRSQQ